MTSKEIQCTYCGLNGEMETRNCKSHIHDRKNVFKHIGHNPYSGHLHYQCPSCKIVLLVPPMDILAGKSVKGVPFPAEESSASAIFTNVLYQFRKVFRSTPAFR